MPLVSASETRRSGFVQLSREVTGDLEPDFLLCYFRLVPFQLHGILRVVPARLPRLACVPTIGSTPAGPQRLLPAHRRRWLGTSLVVREASPQRSERVRRIRPSTAPGFQSRARISRSSCPSAWEGRMDPGRPDHSRNRLVLGRTQHKQGPPTVLKIRGAASGGRTRAAYQCAWWLTWMAARSPGPAPD